MAQRLKPKNDFLFKRLFGETESKNLLISLLNAILHPADDKKIIDVTVIDNKELVKEVIDGKSGRLDVRCETEDNEQIDLEVQIERDHAMDKRTLFYLSKLFVGSIKEGHDYDLLKKTITINILDFNYLPLDHFHNTFHLYDDGNKEFMLTDIFEIHFLECLKFRAMQHDLNNPLHRWLLFLDEKVTEQQLEELMTMDSTIKTAEERLQRLSCDEETLRLYEAREEAFIEYNSGMSAARRAGLREGIEIGEKNGEKKGIQKGIQQGKQDGKAEGKQEVARNMLALGLDIEAIVKCTGLTIDELDKLK
ncbi:Rpn family recombination-promoting nuclease/putative transposase [Cohnella herbarum]|uniref:Rpn family recombination-promoting nuclease/putative transposase n=1 Tax=Cohnella herbarum TaxID=2728023 RepID=A0A7Z2VRW8_9BACL|nr:Rpn family recombination-promoting nuclease/putative transposase [Cohnella herbarum]